jgi:hypothetical protein
MKPSASIGTAMTKEEQKPFHPPSQGVPSPLSVSSEDHSSEGNLARPESNSYPRLVSQGERHFGQAQVRGDRNHAQPGPRSTLSRENLSIATDKPIQRQAVSSAAGPAAPASPTPASRLASSGIAQPHQTESPALGESDNSAPLGSLRGWRPAPHWKAMPQGNHGLSPEPAIDRIAQPPTSAAKAEMNAQAQITASEQREITGPTFTPPVSRTENKPLSAYQMDSSGKVPTPLKGAGQAGPEHSRRDEGESPSSFGYAQDQLSVFSYQGRGG